MNEATQALWNKAASLIGASEWSGALAVLDELERLCPEDPRPLYNKAAVLTRMQRQEEAKSCLLKVLGIEPDHQMAKKLLSSIDGDAGGRRPVSPTPPAATPPPPPAQPVTAPPASGRVFTGEGGQFSICLQDAGWVQTPAPDRTPVQQNVSLILDLTNPNMGRVVFTTETGAAMDFETLWGVWEKVYHELIGEFTVTRKERDSVGGLPAMVVEFDGIEEGEKKHFITYAFFKNRELYHFWAAGWVGYSAQLKEEFLSAIKSLSFADQKVPQEVVDILAAANRDAEGPNNLYWGACFLLLAAIFISAWIRAGFWVAAGVTLFWALVALAVYASIIEKAIKKKVRRKHLSRLQAMLEEKNLSRVDIAPLICHTYTWLVDIW